MIAASFTFNSGGSHWQAETIEHYENDGFTWSIVMARWCGYGPRPLWADELHRFVFDRKRKSDGLLLSELST